eukprot:Rhum_TRINITY_DN3618_c0_g2::Rhum_TRINITY_DN3618_c0_g2_i1::g.11530::m.11530
MLLLFSAVLCVVVIAIASFFLFRVNLASALEGLHDDGTKVEHLRVDRLRQRSLRAAERVRHVHLVQVAVHQLVPVGVRHAVRAVQRHRQGALALQRLRQRHVRRRLVQHGVHDQHVLAVRRPARHGAVRHAHNSHVLRSLRERVLRVLRRQDDGGELLRLDEVRDQRRGGEHVGLDAAERVHRRVVRDDAVGAGCGRQVGEEARGGGRAVVDGSGEVRGHNGHGVDRGLAQLVHRVVLRHKRVAVVEAGEEEDVGVRDGRALQALDAHHGAAVAPGLPLDGQVPVAARLGPHHLHGQLLHARTGVDHEALLVLRVHVRVAGAGGKGGGAAEGHAQSRAEGIRPHRDASRSNEVQIL